MRPPEAHGAAIPAGWPGVAQPPGGARRSSLTLPRRAGLLAIAVAVLVTALGGAAYLRFDSGPGPAASAAPGTAFLGTTTCADWRRASVARRLSIVRSLGIAATQPDPENPGATLGEGAAYGLFQRVCSTDESRWALLYEAYNRAASFQGAPGRSGSISGRFGRP